ncbi:hypothetical protein BU24DRAFT_430677 [Aaosphaeria arxii CBS 175.79]|uniref:DUF7896 domain-containing protein n=1 Tax=Aaosphaeria arxii CBS 175.79 TaxID=1450172 RepID=A0A6A5YAE4_9PLEO|nr:uncharacterized protein BU24DRAFT_430677 [Aaosphaeria arxii CBS 175.79]KAF2022319.1 hypothetical protein BU24DRAFT_430677 [Aaosphaeria arxii CBS 175.79]
MPPKKSSAKMKEDEDPKEPHLTKETVLTPPTNSGTPTTSPTFQAPSKTPPRRVVRLKCPTCNDYPDGFRSEHELRRHTNRVHRKTRKVWVTIDTSPDKSFLSNCKACQTGKRYNECYNAASHLRRMHFHPHKRGERKMTAAEARRGGKPGDLDPPMELLKANWLREVEEFVGEAGDEPPGSESETAPPTPFPQPPQAQTQPTVKQVDGKAPLTPTTPSTRSMAIESIVDKVDAT